MLNLKKFFMFKQLSENSETTYRFSLCRLVSWANENQLALEKLDEESLQAFLEAQTTWNHNSKYSAYCTVRNPYYRWQFGDACVFRFYRFVCGVKKPPTKIIG